MSGSNKKDNTDKNMNKKKLSLIGLSLLLLTGCNNKSNSSTKSNSSNNSIPNSQQSKPNSKTDSTSKTDSKSDPVVPSEVTGSGTEDDPYVIYTGEQLGEIADTYNELTAAPEYTYYKLGNDIDLNEVDYAPIGSSSVPFYGEFDGDGHKISNLKLEDFSKSNPAYGLFAYTYGSSIHDVELSIDFTFSPRGAGTSVFVGGLVGYGSNTEIYNVDIDGEISLTSSQNTSAGLYVGGIAGILTASNNYFVNLTNSTSDVDITCDMEDSQNTTNVVGGVVGSVLTSHSSSEIGIYSISSTYYHGNIAAKDCAAGIVGTLYYYVSITDCVAEGDSISATAENGCYAAGIVGQGYYMTGVLNTYANFKTILASNTSSNATYKAFAGSTIGFAFASYEDLYDMLGTINYSNYASKATITSDKTGVNGLEVPSDKSIKTAAGLSDYWQENNGKLTLSKFTQEKNVTVKLDSNYEGGSSQNVDVTFIASSFDSTGIQTVSSKEFTREHYCYSGLYYDKECTQPYCEFIPFSSNTTLYAGYGDYSKLVGTYDYVCSSSSSSITNSGIWHFDEDYFYWQNDYEIIKYTYKFDGTYVFLDSTNSGSYAGEMFMLDDDGKLHAYDINDSDYEYVATKRATDDFVIPDYTGKAYLGTWYFSNNAIVTLNADGNASAKTTTYTADITGGYRELEDGSLGIKIYARINATVKYDATNDIFYGKTSTGTTIFGARESITKTYSSTDSKLYIYVVGDNQYTIYNDELSSFTGSLTEGGEIKVGDDTYTVSGTTLTLKDKTPSIPNEICGTYTDKNENTMILNNDGTGSWNETSFTWTYDSTTKKGKISAFGAFDSEENSVTFNDDGTVTVSIDDSYNENSYSATMTKKASTPAYVGTWTCKAMSNKVTIVLNDDGTGTYNGTAITYTVSGNTISISNVGDLENITFTFDETNGITSGSYEYDYDTYYYSDFEKQA